MSFGLLHLSENLTCLCRLLERQIVVPTNRTPSQTKQQTSSKPRPNTQGRGWKVGAVSEHRNGAGKVAAVTMPGGRYRIVIELADTAGSSRRSLTHSWGSARMSYKQPTLHFLRGESSFQQFRGWVQCAVLLRSNESQASVRLG